VGVTAQVNNLANAVFRVAGGGGSLSRFGSTFYLDYGTLALGDMLNTTMALANDVAGTADELAGAFDTSSLADFSFGGWNPFSGLAAGDSVGGLALGYLASNAGAFTQTITFNGRSVNTSDPKGILRTAQLVLRGNVMAGGGGGSVPEPGSISLVLLAAAAAGWSARRRKTAQARVVQ